MDSALNPLAAPASDVIGRFEATDEARALPAPGDSVDSLLNKLGEAALWPDALKLLAYALSKPQAVYWAWLCAETIADSYGPAQKQAQLVAQAWLRQPDETNRLPAQAASEAAGLDSAPGCVALAVFWSGGSMAPPDAPAVPPPEHLSHHAAACAAQMAAGIRPEFAANTYPQFINLGREVAAGKRIS